MRVVTVNYSPTQDKTSFNWNMEFLGGDTLEQLDALKDAIRGLEMMYETVLEDFQTEFKNRQSYKTIKSILGV